MNRKTVIAASLLTLASPALTIPAFSQGVPAVQIQQAIPPAVAAVPVDPMMQDVAALQGEWARIKYQVSEKDRQLDAIHKLESQAALISAKYPDKAEPKIWEGIILSTEGGITKSISSLSKVRKAKELFETSLKQDSNALQGSAHTSLGSLYYQVPGWPVAFGDDDLAEEHLKHALQMNPDGIDPNYFYGDFLLQDGQYKQAQIYLNKALAAPDRPGRELADAGRRQEIKAALAQAVQKLNDKGKADYN